MNVAALLQDSPSDDSHRRRPAPPPSNSGSSGSPEHLDHGAGPGGGGTGGGERTERVERAERAERTERAERGERGSGGPWPPYDRTRVQSQSQNTWPPPHPRPAPSSAPSTPISNETSPYAHPKEPSSSWQQSVGNPYPPTPSAPYDTSSSAPAARIRANSNAASHPPPTTGPGVPPPLPPSGSSYMPPPDFPPHLHRPPPPASTSSTSHYSTPVPVTSQPRLPMSHSPPIGGSPYSAGPPPPSSSSTPRRPQSQLATPQPPHVHGPPSSHPSPAMASLQNPTSGPWGPGVPGPGMVDGRERDSLRDRTHPPLERERPADRDREMNPPPRDRERDWDPARDRPRPKLPPAGPGIPPPPLTGPGTGAPPSLAPGVPSIIGPGISEDPHKLTVSSAPASGVPSRAHSRSQLSKDDITERPKDLERASRIPERDMPPAGLGRTDYPPRDYPPHRREPGEIMVPVAPNRREREEYIGPGGSSGSSRPPPAGHPADYRPPSDYGREPPPPDYKRSLGEYRQFDYRREPPYPPGEYREPPSGYRHELPPGPSSGEYRRDPPPGDYRDPRREQHPSLDYRRDPALGDYRRGAPPSDYRGPPDYRDARRERDLPPPTSSGHSPEAYRRDPQDYPPSRRNSNESRRERDKEREREIMSERERVGPRRGEPGAGPVIPPGERHLRHSPYQSRELDREPYHRRPEPGDYRRDPASGPIPSDYRGPPPENYRPSEYRPPHPDYHREAPPPDFPPQRRDHHVYPPDLRRDDYPRPPHPHGPPGPPQLRSDYRPPPPPEHRGQEYRPELPPRPPPDHRRDSGPTDYRGPPGSLPPPGEYVRQGPPGQEFKGRESGEILPPRDYPRRDREREHLREGDYSRPPTGDYPRRRDEDYMIRSSQQPGSLPPGPGIPGRASTPGSEMYAKHPSERERDRERERWEQKERERNGDRGHYPPPSTTSSTSGHPPPSHHHSHSHPKPHPHHPHHHPHHHHVIHQHQHSHHGHGAHQHPSPPGPPTGPGGTIPVGQGSPQSQSVGPPPPSQRQLQGQFPTRFVSVHAQPGSRIGSPIPGPVAGPSGSSRDMRKDVGSSMSVGKDVKKIRSGVPPGPGIGPSGRRERDEREKERDIHQSYPQPPPQPLPHRDGQGRVLGHGYPHGHGPHRPHGQPLYDDYPMIDDMEQQQIQIQNQHHIHPPPPHPQQQGPILQHPLPLPSYPLPPHVGYYPSQEAVDELWPPEQPDKEVKSKFKINLGTFVYPNTPFPYYFDVGEWVGMNANFKEQNERGERPKGVEVEKEKEKEVVAENKMDVDGEERTQKEKESEVEKTVLDKETEVQAAVTAAVVDESMEKEKGPEKQEEKDKEKEKEKEERGGEREEKEREREAKEKEKIVEAKADEDDDILDVETRAIILIPNGYIPREKPPTPHIWGGGVIGRPINHQRRVPPTPNQTKPESPVRPKKRRIYTDDSDLFLCALHSGWLTWSASARARDTGKDVRIEVRIIRCTGTGAGSVFAVGAGAFAGKYAPAENSVVSTVSPLRKNKITKLPVVRKEEIVGRFIGGWGEKCFIREFEGETDDEDNDGRGLVSAGWGSGHDGSAIEVVNVELVEKGTAKKLPGTGRRNRAQRLLEYSERRAAVLGLQRLAVAPRLAGRKRRRNWDPYPPTRRLPNATALDIIPELLEDDIAEDEQAELPMEPERKEEASLMGVRTITFGTGLAGDMRLGYKYQPDVLKDILFPAPSSSISDRPPPRKRRRTTIASEDILMDVDSAESEPPAPTPNRPVILETPKESYLLSLTHGSEFSPEGRLYDISLILEGEVEEDREDAVVLHVADKNAVKAAQEVPPLTPPPVDEPEEWRPVTVASATSNPADGDRSKPSNDEPREEPLNSTQDTTRSTSSTVAKADSSLPPSRSHGEVQMLNKDTAAAKPQGDKSESVPKTLQKVAFKHPVAQVLQRRVGEDMFRFTEEGVNIADGEDSMRTEWLVQVKSWKWATRKIVRV